MSNTTPSRDILSIIKQFRTSDHWGVSFARDLLWVICVVGCIALLLYLICGTWPAIVTIESGSMTPHLNKGDLVVVVQMDRFGDFQTWNMSKTIGYKKFGDYGDVIIYRPNGYIDFWTQVGLLPLSAQHPIIHRTMTWIDANNDVPQFINLYKGSVTPMNYLPLSTHGITTNGYTILTAGNATQDMNFSASDLDVIIKSRDSGNFMIPARYVDGNTGYIRDMGIITSHGGYITKGDNNPTSDQGSILDMNIGKIEPVQKDWIVGKALFNIPLVGYLPLYIGPIIVIVIVFILLQDIYSRRKEQKSIVKQQKKIPKKNR